MHFENVVPILRVADLQASIAYYTRKLGFTIDWHVPGQMASVSRGPSAVMLCLGDQGHAGTWVWMGVSNAAALFEEYTAAGAVVRLPPTNYPWALEIHVQDPDGHVLRLGSGPLQDQPFSDWVAWYR